MVCPFTTNPVEAPLMRLVGEPSALIVFLGLAG